MKIAVQLDITALMKALKRRAHDAAAKRGPVAAAKPRMRATKPGGRDGIGRA